MNKSHRIITVLALATFSLIIGLHYFSWDNLTKLTGMDWSWSPNPLILDIHMPLFVLGVLYAGCMALAKRPIT